MEYIGPASAAAVSTATTFSAPSSIPSATNGAFASMDQDQPQQVIHVVREDNSKLYEYDPATGPPPPPQGTATSATDYASIIQHQGAAAVQAGRPDALQAAVESAEVDKMDTTTLLLPMPPPPQAAAAAVREGEGGDGGQGQRIIFESDLSNAAAGAGGGLQDEQQDPRLIGDAYLYAR